jgi:hypothetical protein
MGKPLNLAGRPQAPAAPLLIPPGELPDRATVASHPVRPKAVKPTTATVEWVLAPPAPVQPVVAKPTPAPRSLNLRQGQSAEGASGREVAKSTPAPRSWDHLTSSQVEAEKPAAAPKSWALAEPPPFPAQMYRHMSNSTSVACESGPIPLDGARASAAPAHRSESLPASLPEVETVGWKAPAAPIVSTVPASAKQPATPSPETPSGLGHAPDYTWLIGTVNYLHAKKIWTVRYAGLDEEDAYGGSVTLIENERTNLERLQPGQMVRVEGNFADREPSGVAPRYRVTAIRPLP